MPCGLIIDLFAGGGGASTGMTWALGYSPDIAINHDAEALAMHAANHPGTLHLCANVLAVNPLYATGGQPVDVLHASPDCTHFSKAKGGKPRSQHIRDLAWVVVRWAEEVRPRLITLENVVEFQTWGRLMPTASRSRHWPGRRSGRGVGGGGGSATALTGGNSGLATMARRRRGNGFSWWRGVTAARWSGLNRRTAPKTRQPSSPENSSRIGRLRNAWTGLPRRGRFSSEANRWSKPRNGASPKASDGMCSERGNRSSSARTTRRGMGHTVVSGGRRLMPRLEPSHSRRGSQLQHPC